MLEKNVAVHFFLPTCRDLLPQTAERFPRQRIPEVVVVGVAERNSLQHFAHRSPKFYGAGRWKVRNWIFSFDPSHLWCKLSWFQSVNNISEIRNWHWERRWQV